MPRHTGPPGDIPGVGQEAGAKGKPRPEPLLGPLQGRQGRAGRQLGVDWFEEFQHAWAWGLSHLSGTWPWVTQGREYWRGVRE